MFVSYFAPNLGCFSLDTKHSQRRCSLTAPGLGQYWKGWVVPSQSLIEGEAQQENFQNLTDSLCQRGLGHNWSDWGTTGQIGAQLVRLGHNWSDWGTTGQTGAQLVRLGHHVHKVPLMAIALELAGQRSEGVTQDDLEASQKLLKDDCSMVSKEEGLSDWGRVVKSEGSAARGRL
eukprot:1148645-Pelagomonas_calceolata.AAC.4